jgi:tight adherence protein B
MITFLPILALLPLVLGVGVLCTAFAMGRSARLELGRHVGLVATTFSEHQRVAERPNVQIVQNVGEWFRNILLTGIRFRWGVRSSALLLLVVAVASIGGVWLCLHLLLRFSNLIAIPGALVCGFAVPHFLLRIEQAKSGQKFMDIFPNAVDMVVRMLRAGLPIASTMRAVSREAGDPVDSVFGTIADGIEIGIPFEESLSDAAEKVGLADFQFFAIAVALQRTTGGNLAATLEILCDIVRKRRAVRLKAKAATAEVRISAYVLGGIPVFVVGALMVVAPNYLTPLINDPRGNTIVAIAIFMLFLAFFSMRTMMKSATRL